MDSPVVRNRPFLRWAGSKRQLIPDLRVFWQSGKYQRYIEPFAGSASFFFSIRPNCAILGDMNRELIDAMEQIRANPAAVHRRMLRMKSGEQAYYHTRAIDPKTLSAIGRAARFIYLNRFCFNGIYRTNRSGMFNVPYGGGKSGALPSKQLLESCASALKKTRLFCADFEDTLGLARAGDFVYLDPPYSLGGKRIFREYGPSTFNSGDLDRLHGCIDQLDRLGAVFLLSYAATSDASRLFTGYRTTVVQVRRNVAGFSAKRKIVDEFLISNI